MNKTSKHLWLLANNQVKNIQWWEDKNEDKERNLEYDLDFEHEIVHHISCGETLQTMEVTDDS